MSLTFNPASSQRVVIAPATSIDNLSAGTAMVLFRTSSMNQNSRVLIAKGSYLTGTTGWVISGRTNGTTRLVGRVYRATTNTEVVPSGNAYTSGEWTWVAMAWNLAGSPTLQVYTGNLTSPMTSYASTTGGAGAYRADTADDLQYGNYDGGGSTNTWGGGIAVGMVYNRRLTLDEILAIQFNPQRGVGCVAYHRFGDNGTGTQYDLSGNGNHGTVTGATQTANATLPRWRMA